MLGYLTSELDWQENQPYEILTGKVHPWRWNASNGYVNLTGKLASAMRDNPKLRVLVQCGNTDLATPSDGMLYSTRQMLALPAELQPATGPGRHSRADFTRLRFRRRCGGRRNLIRGRRRRRGRRCRCGRGRRARRRCRRAGRPTDLGAESFRPELRVTDNTCPVHHL